MKFYKVKIEKDNCNIYKTVNGKKHYAGFIVGNELFTEKELAKNCIPLSYVFPVQVSKRNTHWFFGCRFENE